jgi:hypothetical protein
VQQSAGGEEQEQQQQLFFLVLPVCSALLLRVAGPRVPFRISSHSLPQRHEHSRWGVAGFSDSAHEAIPKSYPHAALLGVAETNRKRLTT